MSITALIPATKVTIERSSPPNITPQPDIASSHPQTTFSAGTFPFPYAYVNKDVSPKISQNPKPNRKPAEIYGVANGPKDINPSTHIHNPSRASPHAIHAEVPFTTHSHHSPRISTPSHVPSPACLRKRDSQMRLPKLSTPHPSARAGRQIFRALGTSVSPSP
jgi:hypothetical protein